MNLKRMRDDYLFERELRRDYELTAGKARIARQAAERAAADAARFGAEADAIDHRRAKLSKKLDARPNWAAALWIAFWEAVESYRELRG